MFEKYFCYSCLVKVKNPEHHISKGHKVRKIEDIKREIILHDKLSKL